MNHQISNIKRSEPWFDTRLESITGQQEWEKKDEIIWNQIQRQTHKHEFFIKAFDFISDNKIEGNYHEFGCHRCRTFRMAMLEAKRHFLSNMRFIAYDSFKGMPGDNTAEAFDSRWNKGNLSTSAGEFLKLIQESGFDTEKVSLVEGFYDNTLKNLTFAEEDKAALITIDCDLYESAVPIFKILDSIAQEGTLLYIDDYFTGYKGNPLKGVSKALREWEKKSRWQIEPYREVGWAGKSYVIYPND